MYVVVFAIIIGIIAIDQIIKNIVVNTLAIGQTIPLIDGVFHFTYVQNYGAAFSILQNRQTFLIAITGIVMAVIFVFLLKNLKKFDKLTIFSLAMIVGGGVGNIIDRIRYDYVVDFLDFRLVRFPVFNFADCCIVIGAILLIIAVFLSHPKEEQEPQLETGTKAKWKDETAAPRDDAAKTRETKPVHEGITAHEGITGHEEKR